MTFPNDDAYDRNDPRRETWLADIEDRSDVARDICTGCDFPLNECHTAKKQGAIKCCPDCHHKGASA